MAEKKYFSYVFCILMKTKQSEHCFVLCRVIRYYDTGRERWQHEV